MELFCHGNGGTHEKTMMNEMANGSWRCPECHVIVTDS